MIERVRRWAAGRHLGAVGDIVRSILYLALRFVVVGLAFWLAWEAADALAWHAIGAALAVFLLPGLAVAFGQWVYPGIHPAFGGAGAQGASKAGADSTHLDTARADAARSAAAPPRHTATAYVLALPAGKVNGLAQLGVFVSAPEYADSLRQNGCGYLPASGIEATAGSAPERIDSAGAALDDAEDAVPPLSSRAR